MTEELTSASNDALCPPPPRWGALWKAEQARKAASHKARMAEIATELRAEKKRLYDEKRREDQRINSASYRARKKASVRSQIDAELQDLLEDLASLDDDTPLGPSPDAIAREVHQFAEWLRLGGDRQAQYRKDRHDYMRSRIVLLEVRAEFDQDPSYNDFARLLAARFGGEWTKETARTRLKALRRLEGADGPWTAFNPR